MPKSAAVEHNPVLLCAFHALHMSLFPVAVLSLYFRDEIGLSVTAIMGVQAIFGLVIAVCEFPSGYLADRLGYRRALLCGSALVALGWTFYASAGTVLGIIIAEIWLGAGLSLISGADSAMLYESLRATGRETEFGTWYGRMRSAGQVAEGSSALAAGALYASWTRLPFVLEIVVWVLALLVARRLANTPAAPVEPHAARGGAAHARRMAWIFRHALHDNRRLRAVIYLTTTLGLATYIPVWLVPLYASDAGVSATSWGFFWAASSYTVAIASLSGAGVRKRFGLHSSVLGCVLLVVVGYLGLGLSHSALGIAYYLCLTWVRGAHTTLLHHEEQLLIGSGDRASFVSLRSLVFRVSFVVAGPGIGYAVERFGQHAIYVALAGGLGLLAGHGWRLLRSSNAPASLLAAAPAPATVAAAPPR